MTRKRFIKELMYNGISRNVAVDAALHVRKIYGEYEGHTSDGVRFAFNKMRSAKAVFACGWGDVRTETFNIKAKV